jgi:hypothetical protein
MVRTVKGLIMDCASAFYCKLYANLRGIPALFQAGEESLGLFCRHEMRWQKYGFSNPWWKTLTGML